MIRPVTLLLCLALPVAGCARIAESRLNPFTWFGGGQSAAVSSPGSAAEPLVRADQLGQVYDARVPIARVVSLSLEPVPAGAIVRATGLAATQGFFNAELVRRSVTDGVLVYDFRVEAPPAAPGVGSEASRTIAVADRLSRGELAGIRAVRVQSAGNALQATR